MFHQIGILLFGLSLVYVVRRWYKSNKRRVVEQYTLKITPRHRCESPSLCPLTGQDHVVSMLQIPIVFGFDCVLDSCGIVKGLQELVDRYPILCGTLRHRGIPGGAPGVSCIAYGDAENTSGLSFTYTQLASPGSTLECSVSEMSHHIPKLRGGLLSVRLVSYPESRKSVLLLNVHHIIADGQSIGYIFSELCNIISAICANRTVPAPELVFSRSPIMILPRDKLTVGSPSAPGVTYQLPDLKKSFPWMPHSPLPGWTFYLTSMKILPRLIFAQTKIFRFSAATLNKMKCNSHVDGCTVNDILVSLIATSVHALNPSKARKRGGMGVAQILSFRGSRCGSSVPANYIGNPHSPKYKWNKLDVLNQAAATLWAFEERELSHTPEGEVNFVDPLIVSKFCAWRQKTFSSNCSQPLIEWFSRVHHMGLNSKLLPGTIYSLLDGDIIIDNVGFPLNCALPGHVTPLECLPSTPTEMVIPMPVVPGLIMIVSRNPEGDKDVMISLPRSQLSELSSLWHHIATS
ncbi:hypothetical protein Pelo_15117 [Pelomyxa schiedti]|nr:hypothetical protein Pelo_15117 [Pelomyxa schiedti]